MAKEYIERKAVIDLLKNKYQDMSAMPASYYAGFQYALKMVEAMKPTADVAPVRHGKWIDLREDDMDYEWKYSSCGETFGMAHEDVSPYDVGLNCCPNCGCRMDLEG